MQHDKDSNCYYCGYGPQNRSPTWSNWHPGICCVTHSNDPPEKAHNKTKWREYKKLPPNLGSGGGQTITLYKSKETKQVVKRQIKSTRKHSGPKKANRPPPPPPPSVSPPILTSQALKQKSYYTLSPQRWKGIKRGEV